jgi:hypothetical protein
MRRPPHPQGKDTAVMQALIETDDDEDDVHTKVN